MQIVKRILFLVIFVGLFFSNNCSFADVYKLYKYEDDEGIIHLTNDYNSEECRMYGCKSINNQKNIYLVEDKKKNTLVSSHSTRFQDTKSRKQNNFTINGYTLTKKEQLILKTMLIEDSYYWIVTKGKSSSSSLAPFWKDLFKNSVNVTAEQLQYDYSINIASAEQKYQKENLFLSGVVLKIGRSAMNQYRIIFAGGDGFMAHPVAYMEDGYEGFLAGTRVGERIYLVCKGARTFITGSALAGPCVPIINWMERQSDNLISEALNKEAHMLAISAIAVASITPDTSSCVQSRKYQYEKCASEIEKYQSETNKRQKLMVAANKLKLSPDDLQKIFPSRDDSSDDSSKMHEKVSNNVISKSDADNDKTMKLTAVECFEQGQAFSKTGNYSKAIEYFTKAIELDPKYAEAYNKRGIAYSRLERYKQAIDNFDRTTELNSQYAEAYYNRGMAHYKLNDEKSCLDEMRTAAELGDKDAQDFLKNKMR